MGMRQPVIAEFKTSAKQARDYESITISWKTECAKYVSLNGVHVSASGEKEIPATETVTLKASNNNGRIEKTIRIKVSHPMVLSKFSVNNDNIQLGRNCIVRWNGQNIKKVSFQGKEYSAIGPLIFKPTISSDYEVLFEGVDGNTIKKSFALHIIYPPPVINVDAPTFARMGDTVHVDWTTKYISSVKLDGIEQPLTGTFEWTFSEVFMEKTLIFVDMEGVLHEKKIYVKEALPPRILSFDSNVKEVNDDQSVTLSWTTENARYVSLNGTRVSANGTGDWPASCDYVLKVSNKFGVVTSAIKINVLHPVQITSFKVNKTELNYGTPCFAEWTGSNVKYIFIDGKKHRVISPLTFTPKESRPYTIRFKGPDDNIVEKSIGIYVIVPEPILNIETPKYGIPGATVKIMWQMENVKSVKIGGLTYSPNDSYEWCYEKEDCSRTLLITKVDDTTLEKTIEIRPAYAPEINSIVLSEEKVKIGDFCRLSWSGNYVDKWFIEGKSTQSGDVNSIHVKVMSEVIKVHFVGEDGREIKRDINVELIPEPGEDEHFRAVPEIQIEEVSASRNYIKAGETVTLTWNSNYVKSVTISDIIGEKASSGSIDIVIREPKRICFTFNGINGAIKRRYVQVNIIPHLQNARIIVSNNEVNKGESCTIKWYADNAKYVMINGVIRSMNQWYEFNPSYSQSIKVIFYGNDGSTCERSVYILVKEQEIKEHNFANGCLQLLLLFLGIISVIIALSV